MDLRSKIIDIFPNEFVKKFAIPYIAGDNLSSAIQKSIELYSSKKLLSTIEVLGEDVKTYEAAEHNLVVYKSIVDAIDSNRSLFAELNIPTLSTKPSSLTKVFDNKREFSPNLNLGFSNLEKVVSYAKEKDVKVTIDMENHLWTDFTLNSYFKLLNSGYDNIGTVIQTRLDRTKEDIKRFKEGSRVRLCIGIYDEPKDIATKDKAEMKNRLVEYSKYLMKNRVYVEFASHDMKTIGRFFEESIVPRKISNSRYEIQMLLGVPRENQQKELVNGNYLRNFSESDYLVLSNRVISKEVKVRLYVPFGESWDQAVAYAKRRLNENPDFWNYGAKMMIGSAKKTFSKKKQ